MLKNLDYQGIVNALYRKEQVFHEHGNCKKGTVIKPSPTLATAAKAKAMKAQGIDVVDFGVGEPDFDTPENVKQAGIKAIQSGFTKYTPAGGTDELKEAVIEKFKKDNGLSV